jgi:hypothetical protein
VPRHRVLIRSLTTLVALPLLYFTAALIGAIIPGHRADLTQGTDVLI